MANTMLPKQIDLFQSADSQKTLKGEIELSEMQRLSKVLVGVPAKAAFELCFGRDVQGYAYLRGTIKTRLELICQRCNQPMCLDLDIKVEASPVRTDEEAESLPKHYDPLLQTGDTVSLLTMIEDEILLSIPIVPKHSMKECSIKSSELVEWEGEEEKQNPFEVLKKLLRE